MSQSSSRSRIKISEDGPEQEGRLQNDDADLNAVQQYAIALDVFLKDRKSPSTEPFSHPGKEDLALSTY